MITTLWNKSFAGKLIVLFAFALGCCLFSAVASSLGGGREPRRSVYVAPAVNRTIVPTPTLPEPTAAPSLEQIAQMICGEDYVETFRVEGTATVTCNFNPPINDETMAVGVMMDFKSLAKRAWEIEPGLLHLNLHLKTKMQDKLGNEKESVTVRLGISSDLATQINWNNVGHRALPGILASNDPRSSIWVHPVFESAWLMMIANQ